MQENDAPAVASADDLVKFRETLHVEILKYSHGASDAEREQARRQGRASLLATLDERGLPLHPVPSSKSRSAGEHEAQFLSRLGDEVQPAAEGFGSRFLVCPQAVLVPSAPSRVFQMRFIELKLQFPQIEPLFCTATLYDVKACAAAMHPPSRPASAAPASARRSTSSSTRTTCCSSCLALVWS